MLLCKSAIVCHVGYPNLLPLLMHADYSSSWHLYLRCQTATVSRGFNEIFFDTSIPVSTVALSSPRYSEIRFCILPSWPRPFHVLCFFFFLMASQASHFQDIDVLVPVVPTTNWIGPASDLRFLGLGKGGEVQRTTHTPYLVSVSQMI